MQFSHQTVKTEKNHRQKSLFNEKFKLKCTTRTRSEQIRNINFKDLRLRDIQWQARNSSTSLLSIAVREEELVGVKMEGNEP